MQRIVTGAETIAAPLLLGPHSVTSLNGSREAWCLHDYASTRKEQRDRKGKKEKDHTKREVGKKEQRVREVGRKECREREAGATKKGSTRQGERENVQTPRQA